MELGIPEVTQHWRRNGTYTLRDFQMQFSNTKNQDVLREFKCRYLDKPLHFFQSNDDYQALQGPAFMSEIAQYRTIPELPEGIITDVTESRDHTRKRFIYETEDIEDYVEGESFKELYIEGGTELVRWRKPGAKIVHSDEAVKDLTLPIMTLTAQLALNEFRRREWRHLMHALHVATSNQFVPNATDRNGKPLDLKGWREFFDNVSEQAASALTWNHVRDSRRDMMNRERDAVRPTVLLTNATNEANLPDDARVNQSNQLSASGTPATFFLTGTLPNIYGLTTISVPDALFGSFTNDVSRKSSEFITSPDAFLIAGNDGPTLMRHTREPLTTEAWRDFDRMQQKMNMWQRYEYSVFKYTNIRRIRLTTAADSIE